MAVAKKREAVPDLRQEIAKRARDPAVVGDIADYLIREASGGQGGKGGASSLKALEIVQSILDQFGQSGTASPDYSRMPDSRLRALLASLEEA